MPDEHGETRRERNSRFGQPIDGPALDIPDAGRYLWEWFWSISSRLRRVRDGICEPIPPSEFLAWCQASATLVSATEYAILCAMDEAFCNAMTAATQDYQKRQLEESKKPTKKRGKS